jgi:myo-inositol-1(or 4)-monophosphatase
MSITTLTQIQDLDDLALIGWQAAVRAGEFLLHERPADLRVDYKSSRTDPVTEMDRNAESIIVHHIRESRPDDGFLGEEGSDDPGTSGVRWIIDPLDGTVNYLYGQPLWGVSVAAEVDGILHMGIVITPAQDEAFIGIRGQGSWRVHRQQVERLPGSTVTDLGVALVTTGFGYEAERRRAQAGFLATLAPRIRDLRRLGACVVDLTWLSMGRVDAYYEQGVNLWDFAAGAVIAREAGLVVSGLHSDEPTSDLLLAAPPRLHEELRQLFLEFL